MATAVKVMSEQKRARYSAEYRAEALLLAERVADKTEEVEILGRSAAYFAKKLD